MADTAAGLGDDEREAEQVEQTDEPPRETGVRGRQPSVLPEQPEGHVLAERYRLVRKLGVGGMGVVYEAEHVVTGGRFAVKTLRSGKTASEEWVTRLMREARAASRIGHPAIVDIVDAGSTEDGVPYIVMELLRGETLAEAAKHRTLSFDDIQRIAEQILDALSAAHRRGIVHRDIKPENVFLLHGDELEIKLLDFGIAKHTVGPKDARLTTTGTVMGTPYYMAPEQAQGLRVDLRADLWSTGATLYEACTGSVVFPGPNYNIIIAKLLTEEPPRVRDSKPEVPAKLARAIDGALQRDREARWGSAAEMLDALTSTAPVTPVVHAPAVEPAAPTADEPEVDEAAETIALPSTPVAQDMPADGSAASSMPRMLAIVVAALVIGAVLWFAVGGTDEPTAPASPAADRAEEAVPSPVPIAPVETMSTPEPVEASAEPVEASAEPVKASAQPVKAGVMAARPRIGTVPPPPTMAEPATDSMERAPEGRSRFSLEREYE